MIDLNWVFKTVALTALLYCGASTAQLPYLEWQHDASVAGDGTRSYVHLYDGPSIVDVPGLSSAWSLPTPDGAFLLIPTNTAGGSDYLRFLVTPFLRGTTGFQVVKLNEQGETLWQRFVPTGFSELPYFSSFTPITGTESVKSQRTPDGGLALLAGGEYLVLNANGTVMLRLRDYCDYFSDFAIDTLELNHEGLLIASTGQGDAGVQSRACAIDRNGNEIDRVSTPGNALYVLDYRRDVGFLLKHGTRSFMGLWSDAQLQLRSGTVVHWTKTQNVADDYGTLRLHPAISPSGEVWTYLGNLFTRLDAGGTPVWQIGGDYLGSVQSWLSDGSALISDTDQVWRVIGSNGVQRWQAELSPATYSTFQVTDSQLRVTQWGVGTSVFRHHAVNLQTGALQTHDHPSSLEYPLLTLAPLGQSGIVDVRFATPTLTRDYQGSCSIPGYNGYCARQLNFAQVEVRTRQASGGPVSLLPPSQLGFPLPSYAFEVSPFPSLRVIVQEELNLKLDHLYSKQYVHDGVRNQVQIQRLTPRGGVVWTRNFSANYDLGKAAIRQIGSRLYVSAQELVPELQPGTAKLWSVDMDSGASLWSVSLSSAWQRIESPNSPPNICGLTHDRPHRLQCVHQDTGAITRNELLQGVSADARLIATGRTGDGIRARLLPSDGSAPTGFTYLDLNINGLLVGGIGNEFSVSAGEVAQADARWSASSADGSFFATAAATILPSSRRIALLVARFDASGNRVWQTRIEREQRGFFEQSETTSIAEMADGDVYVALHPRTTPATYKTELCRLNASGALQACWEAPINGRISSLSPDGENLRVWINNSVVDDASPDGAYLYTFHQGIFSAPQLHIAEFTSATNNAVIDFLGSHYVALVARRGSETQTDGAYKLVSVRHTLQDFVFADGLEQQ